MKYTPVNAIWELTMECNLNCRHCGSLCKDKKDNELKTDEALELCREMGQLGLKWVTLSGGEPTMREDWHIIAQHLRRGGIAVNMISNGWSFGPSTAELVRKSGMNTVVFSVDGTEKTHDFIRKNGSHQRLLNAFAILKSEKIKSAAITTVNKLNLHELPEIKEMLIKCGVSGWQLQFGLPMGTLKKHEELVISPEDIQGIIDFAYDTAKESRINVKLAHCFGYFNKKEAYVKMRNKSGKYGSKVCKAGIGSFGILSNGDIVGCTSIRNKDFIEGNIREKKLWDLWCDERSFFWNRDLNKEKLSGFCRKCIYGDLCNGGCANSRLTLGGDVHSENRYCSYNVACKELAACLDKTKDINVLIHKSRYYMDHGYLQLADIAVSRALALAPDDKNVAQLSEYIGGKLASTDNIS